MDKNTITGLSLMALVFLLFWWLTKPSATEQAQQHDQEVVAADSVKNEAKALPLTVDTLTASEVQSIPAALRTVASLDTAGNAVVATQGINATITPDGTIQGTIAVGDKSVPLADIFAANTEALTPQGLSEATQALRAAVANLNKYQQFAPFVGGEAKTVVLKNNVLELTLSSMGGMIERAMLLDPKYTTQLTNPATQIVLFDRQTADYGFVFNTADQRISTADLNFDVATVGDSIVTMTLPLGNGMMWGLRYTLLPDQYTVRMDIVQQGMEHLLPANTTNINLNWNLRMARNEKGRTFEERNSAIYYKFLGDSPDDLSSSKNDDEQLSGRIKWVAFKNQFFSSVLIARNYLATADVESKILKDNDLYLKDMAMQSTLPYDVKNATPASFDFYFGPNDYTLLSDLDDQIATEDDTDLQLTRLVPLGWGLFRWINQLIVIPVFNFLSRFISNYGIIILLLTLFIKLIIFPFTYKSYISQAKMRVLGPEIKEINDKYPGQENAMKRQQETMALYSRAGASPFSGCLPMLLQMPVLIAMFSFFPSAIELRGESFLWAHDLSAPDVIFNLPFTIPFYGSHVSLFCLLMTVVNVIYTRINMQTQPGGNSMPGMKWMMYLMPVMFLFFFNDYASGLSYYYFLSLLITILQTYIFRHVINEDKVRKQMLENAKNPKKRKGFMARLEEAQKRQQAMMREQQKQQDRRRR